MRRAIIITAALALMGTVSYGQVTQVVSRNAVGFVRVEAPVDGLIMASYDWEDIDGQNVDAERLFGDQLPLGAIVHTFDPDLGGGGTYVTDTKGFLGWSTNILFRRGMGFWIQLPDTVTGTSYQVHLMGEVPDSMNAGATTAVRVVNGITQVGYPYPTSIEFTNTTLAKNASDGDNIHYWNGSTYVSENLGFLGWSDPNLVLNPGDAFFYQTSTTQAWTEVKPYTWPE